MNPNRGWRIEEVGSLKDDKRKYLTMDNTKLKKDMRMNKRRWLSNNEDGVDTKNLKPPNKKNTFVLSQ